MLTPESKGNVTANAVSMAVLLSFQFNETLAAHELVLGCQQVELLLDGGLRGIQRLHGRGGGSVSRLDHLAGEGNRPPGARCLARRCRFEGFCRRPVFRGRYVGYSSGPRIGMCGKTPRVRRAFR